ncbi:MAG: UDP-N-acetylmuramate dehydrogenase [Fimbriimonadaceae bacterium]
MNPDRVFRDRPLAPLTTLRAGGSAEQFYFARDSEDLAEAAQYLHEHDLEPTILGSGSNVLPSDQGVPGFTLYNRSTRIAVSPDGEVLADSGAAFQDLFLKTAQAGLEGFSYAVGIPGSVGGALASNAGAYRSCIAEFLTGVEVVEAGKREWISPDALELSYRDSRLRRGDSGRCVVIKLRFELRPGDPRTIYDEARDYQRQRISKQPPPASAGSFFKNVYDQALADSLPDLPERLRAGGVVPSGFLIEGAGLRGHRIGGAMLAERHANFIVNIGRATASEIRSLAEFAKERVMDRFGVEIEEEVLYLGDWSGWKPVG